jgi:hypothetical protein
VRVQEEETTWIWTTTTQRMVLLLGKRVKETTTRTQNT